MIQPIHNTDKVDQTSLGLSLKPSNSSEFPTAYADNIWDIVADGSKLSELLENIGSFDQHTINELFATILLGGGVLGAHSFDDSFDSSFEI